MVCFRCKRCVKLDKNLWRDKEKYYPIARKRIVFMVCLGKGYQVGIDVRGAKIMISVTTRLTCEQEKDIAKTEYYDGHLQLFHGHSPARLIRSSKTCQSVWFKYLNLIGHLSSGIWSYMSLKRGFWRNSQVPPCLIKARKRKCSKRY